MNDNWITQGDFYADCGLTARVCAVADYERDEIRGVSLHDGSLGSCSPHNCDPIKLTADQALYLRANRSRVSDDYRTGAHQGEALKLAGLS